GIELAERLGDPVAQSAGLGSDATTVEGGHHVELVAGLGHGEGLLYQHLQGPVAAEVLVHDTVVDLDLARAGPQMHPGHGGLPLPGSVVLDRLSAQRALLFLTASGRGFWALWGWASPA